MKEQEFLIHTEHLFLRPCESHDLNCLYQLVIDPNVRRFLFDDRLISQDEVREFIDQSQATFAKCGYGLWLFFEHYSDLIAGFSGLLHFESELPSLIFSTRPDLWGRGYATEATSSILDYVFKKLPLQGVIADVDEPNTGSIRVLEKLGLNRTKRAIVNERPLIYYEIKKNN